MTQTTKDKDNDSQLAKILKANFPWLGESDDSEIPYPDSGADVIEDLEMLYQSLKDKGELTK